MSPLWSSFSPSPSPIFISSSFFSSSLSRLSKWLGTELSPTILLDFPSVLDLATELDHRHHRGADNGATNGGVTNGTQATAGGGYVAEKEEVKFEKLAVDKELLIQVRQKGLKMLRSTFLNTNPRKHWRKRYIYIYMGLSWPFASGHSRISS